MGDYCDDEQIVGHGHDSIFSADKPKKILQSPLVGTLHHLEVCDEDSCKTNTKL